jgi:hypothetical protein
MERLGGARGGVRRVQFGRPWERSERLQLEEARLSGWQWSAQRDGLSDYFQVSLRSNVAVTNCMSQSSQVRFHAA